MKRVAGIVDRVAGALLGGDGGVQLAGGYLFCGGGDVAEFAGRQIAIRSSHRWSEGAADDGTVLIKVAGADCRIEDGTRLVFSDGAFRVIREEGGVFIVLAEYAGRGIAGEEGSELLKRIFHPRGDAGSALRIVVYEKMKTFTQTCSVLLRDGKDAMTALCAAGAAGEVTSAALDGGGQGIIDDLDEAGIVTAF